MILRIASIRKMKAPKVMKTEWPESTRVAYLGPEGTYSHAAALKYFGTSVDTRACTAIADIFAAVTQGDSDFGVVPVENSSEGTVTMTLDCFNTADLHIYGEVMVRIRHCLLTRPDTDADSISRIVSHQQSLGQCRQWLQAHYSGVERVAVSSNGEAARIAAREPGVAAIAGSTAAQLYGLQVVAKNIEDTEDNTTRFLVLSHQQLPGRSPREKTSIVIWTPDAPGTLFKALEPFQRHGISLSKLESRPSRVKAWSYAFYVDLVGHVDDEPVVVALKELKANALDVKILGSYPMAEQDEQ